MRSGASENLNKKSVTDFPFGRVREYYQVITNKYDESNDVMLKIIYIDTEINHSDKERI